MNILFLNQMAGPLFRELAEDVAQDAVSSILYTGHPDTLERTCSGSLSIRAGVGYDRRGNLRRAWSWIHYFFGALWLAAAHPRDMLFIVSNPPFLGLVGLLYKLLRRQSYAVLVYDVYPDVLVKLGTLREGVIVACWRRLNRLVLENADIVFTISDDMARTIALSCDLGRTTLGSAIVIPNWADIDMLKPIEKLENPFAVEQDQVGKTTIIYSGNMGQTHDIEGIIAIARELERNDNIHFLFIGEGAKRRFVEDAINEEGLLNITLLPFQSEGTLPFSMAAGDIGIVAYQPGTEGCIVPSKMYYYLAAGVIPFVICSNDTDLSLMVESERCGFAFRNEDTGKMAETIAHLADDQTLLASYRRRSREVAENMFSRKNTMKYRKVLKQFFFDLEHI